MEHVLKTQVIRKLKKLRKLSASGPAMFRMFRIWETPRAREEHAADLGHRGLGRGSATQRVPLARGRAEAARAYRASLPRPRWPRAAFGAAWGRTARPRLARRPHDTEVLR